MSCIFGNWPDNHYIVIYEYINQERMMSLKKFKHGYATSAWYGRMAESISPYCTPMYLSPMARRRMQCFVYARLPFYAAIHYIIASCQAPCRSYYRRHPQWARSFLPSERAPCRFPVGISQRGTSYSCSFRYGYGSYCWTKIKCPWYRHHLGRWRTILWKASRWHIRRPLPKRKNFTCRFCHRILRNPARYRFLKRKWHRPR